LKGQRTAYNPELDTSSFQAQHELLYPLMVRLASGGYYSVSVGYGVFVW